MVSICERIAVIPARGGSKRIPKKNILPINNKPMIAYTIEAALTSGLFDQVVVSTDDVQIAEIAKQYGAHIPFLRESLADDHSPISAVTCDALIKIEDQQKKSYKTVVQLMANCPLRTAEGIVSAVEYFEAGGTDFQDSCFDYGWMNPWWAHTITDEGVAKPVFDMNLRTMRSQDQPKLYCPTGAIWIAKVPRLLQTQTFYGDDYRFYPMKWQQALDIDSYEDLAMIKVLMDD